MMKIQGNKNILELGILIEFSYFKIFLNIENFELNLEEYNFEMKDLKLCNLKNSNHSDLFCILIMKINQN